MGFDVQWVCSAVKEELTLKEAGKRKHCHHLSPHLPSIHPTTMLDSFTALTLRPSPSCHVQHNRPRKRAIKAAPLVETYISKQRPLLGSYTVCTASDKSHMCIHCGLLQFYVTIACTRQDLVSYTLILC